jgi:hypothetical protein
MPEGTEVRKPVAKATLQGAAVKIDALTISVGVNSFPTARISFHDSSIPESGVLKMAGTDVATRVSAQQQNMFTAQSPNSEVTLDDGKEGILTFSGYISGPEYNLGIQNVGFSTEIVHEASAVNTLNASIYRGNLEELRSSESPLKANIGIGLIALLDLMKKETDPGLPDEESKAIVAQIEENNEAPYKIWKKICTDSEVEWPELEQLLTHDSLRSSITENIKVAYLNSYNDFSQTMQQFQAMFSMMYIPGTAGDSMGYFAPANAAMEDAEDITLKIRSLVMSGGPKALLPLSYVIVRGPRPQIHRSDSYGHIVRRWPDSAQSTGQVVEIGTPSWLPSELVDAQITSETVGDTLDLSAYEEGRVDAEGELYDTLFPEVGELLTRWAKQHYIDFALASSYANIVTDLDVGIKPGVRYNVSSSEGKLFSGFLVHVEHTVSSRPGNLQAHTSLRFSHIEAEGFSLPGKI